jgi:hypothetical protein
MSRPDQSNSYRLKAVASEQRTKLASDPLLKKEWEELAIEWHLMANLAAPAIDQAHKIDIA